METVIGFLVFALLAILLVPLILLITHGGRLRAIEATLKKLNERIAALEPDKREVGVQSAKEAALAPSSVVAPATAAEIRAEPATPPPPIPTPTSVPPPLPIPSPSLTTSAPSPPPPVRRPIDWEAFMGVKLFAWIGGFVLFLGVVFLVKYSFENNLITPRMRIAIGALIGLALTAAGWRAARKNYRVPGQSLCATGILVLYADIFAAHAFYDLISLTPAFALMSCVTIAAFFLAVVFDAQVVVILGLLGGFLTPFLLATGSDHPAALFGYVGLLNAGIAAVVLRKRWDFLIFLTAIGTVVTEFAWVSEFFHVTKAPMAFVIFAGFQLQFLIFLFLHRKTGSAEKWLTWGVATTGVAALAFSFWMLDFHVLSERPLFLFSFVFAVDVGLLVLALKQSKSALFASAAGIGVFAFFACWTATYLSDALLWWGLGAYLLFAMLHSAFAVWPKAASPRTGAIQWQSYIPLLSLVLVWLCVWRNEASPAVWLCVLLINLVAVGLAIATASLRSIVIALLCTIIAAALWIGTAPSQIDDLNGFLSVIAGFGVFFFSAGLFLARRLASSDDARRNIPAFAAALPFLLVVMVVAKLPVVSPTPVFAVAFLLAVLLLGLGIISRTSWIAAVALGGVWVIEREWQTLHFSASHAAMPFGWYIVFALLFIGYAFCTAEKTEQLPWAISALSGALHFWLIFELVSAAYPQLYNGLLPAVFIVPYAVGVFFLVKRCGIDPASGDARLAWQGGAALLFVSLIFPIQFEREWITLGWALEGFALILFYRKVPHRGLRIVGAALLCVAFVRLALNPAVLEYHKRTGTKIWNWYLYAYGITSVCLILGARLFKPPRQNPIERAASSLLYSLGAILIFLLLNVEIADYFSIGPTLTFSFSGDFARDMTYSIAWALFAFALLLVGMRRKSGAVRYAGLGLLLVTLAKLFLHDLGSLSQLYRIGAFIGVAIILIVASFIYQRFLTPAAKTQ